MRDDTTTCWTLIQGAVAGNPADRGRFARRYGAVARAYLAARWRGTAFLTELDDAVQEVFLECFREGGLLDRLDPGRPGGFRAFLYGVIRNVALRVERRHARQREVRALSDLHDVASQEESLSRILDRAWARALVRHAADELSARATEATVDARKRVELLRLRFFEGLSIQEIAASWGVEAAHLHHEYARARREFHEALLAVVAFHHPESTPGEVEREALSLLQLLQES